MSATQQWTVTSGSYTPQYFAIWNIADGSLNRHFQWGMSNVIVENKTWTQQEISDYFDSTKSLYWIS